MADNTESKTRLEDQKAQYRTLLKTLQPINLPMADVKSGRTLRMKKFKANLKSSLQESKFT